MVAPPPGTAPRGPGAMPGVRWANFATTMDGQPNRERFAPSVPSQQSWRDSCSHGNSGFPNLHYYWFSSIKSELFSSFWVALNGSLLATILCNLKTAEVNYVTSFERFSERGYAQCSRLEHTGAMRFYRQQNTHDEKVQSIIKSKWLEEEYDLLHSPHQSMERCLKLQWGLSPTSAKEIKRHSSAQSCKSSVPWFCSVTPF